jgi:hypothetical protein
LDSDLARRLTQAGRKSEEWRTRRDALILEAAGNGATLREIAAASGLTHVGVLHIIRRGGQLEAVHSEPMATTDKTQDENTVFMKPNDHARHHRDL